MKCLNNGLNYCAKWVLSRMKRLKQKENQLVDYSLSQAFNDIYDN